ncbi:MAG: glycine cleavage system aminomethyltransferase GcvT [Bacteroidia bacterium]|nr:glycine cleavage system aminomethyltransferase GcvT [Bacteroidia bacterium]
MLKKTPLSSIHTKLGATFTAFGGWEMPLRYKSELAEHQAVRGFAGLFDLSHMGEFLVRGPKAASWLNTILTNDISKLRPGKAQYTLMVNQQGGVIDDLIVYQLEAELFMLVVNAATTQKDWEWLQSHLPQSGVSLENISDQTVLLALSGPQSESILSTLTSLPVSEMGYYTCTKGTVAKISGVLVSTTGYTGEWTYELFVRQEEGAALWEALQAGGRVSPAGLAARNTLRLEMGYLLYGADMDEETTPLEVGLEWVVKLEKGEFIGRDALRLQKQKGGPNRRLVGLISESNRIIPRAGMPLLDEAGQVIGRITSGSIGPSVGRGIALGFVPATYSVGEQVYFMVREQRMSLNITRPPFLQETSLLQRQRAKL